jgi:hypothetical protein
LDPLSADLDSELDVLQSFTWEELLATEIGTKDVQVRHLPSLARTPQQQLQQQQQGSCLCGLVAAAAAA